MATTTSTWTPTSTRSSWATTTTAEVGDDRSGRLVSPDEGAHADTEKDLVAGDVGIDGGAASAEEAAMHVVEEE